MAEPVLLEDLKKAIDVVRDDQDDELERLIVAARRYVENLTKVALVADEFSHTFASFERVRLFWRPVLSAEDAVLGYLDGSDELVPYEAVRFVPSNMRAPISEGRFFAGAGQVWPTPAVSVGGVRVTYTAGFADGEVPDEFRQAILTYCAAVYDAKVLTPEGERAVAASVAPYLTPGIA